jgi:hypothetical protein
MTITALPTAEEVRIESRLRPEQVSPELADTDALEADIEGRIAEYTAVISNKLSGVGDTANNQLAATLALKKRLLASLYGSAGQLSPAYWEKAKELKAESDEILRDLVNANTLGSDGIANDVFAVNPRRVDGYTQRCGEYSCD